MATRASRFLQLNMNALNDYLRSGRDLKTEAKANFKTAFFQFNAGVSGHRQKQNFGGVFNSRMMIDEFNVCIGAGGRCPPEVSISEWQRRAKQDPMPLQARFESILSLFNKQYFNETDIEMKRHLLAKQLIRKYCRGRRRWRSFGKENIFRCHKRWLGAYPSASVRTSYIKYINHVSKERSDSIPVLYVVEACHVPGALPKETAPANLEGAT